MVDISDIKIEKKKKLLIIAESLHKPTVKSYSSMCKCPISSPSPGKD